MSNYYYGKRSKGPPVKTSIYENGSSCVVLTMEERVNVATLFSILLNVERRTKDGTKKPVAKQPKIKGSHNRGPYYLDITYVIMLLSLIAAKLPLQL